MLFINIGMPRSGTLWRYKLIRDLVIAGGGQDGTQIRKQYLLYPFISGLNADINTLSTKRLLPAMVPSLLGKSYTLNTHDGPSPFAYQMLQKGNIKAVYGYRDPRDCILSILEYSQRAYARYSAVFLELKTVEEATDFFQIYLDIWDEWEQAPNTLIIKYEMLLAEFNTTVDSIVSHLGLEIPQSKLIEVKEQFQPKQKPIKDHSTHFVHGVAHRYKQAFSADELSYLNNRLGPYLEKMGYEI